jgi:hypothetical protein
MGHNKANRNKYRLIQEMLNQCQAQAKKTQITAIGAMDDFDPVIPLGHHIEIHDPDIGQVGRIRDETLIQ